MRLYRFCSLFPYTLQSLKNKDDDICFKGKESQHYLVYTFLCKAAFLYNEKHAQVMLVKVMVCVCVCVCVCVFLRFEYMQGRVVRSAG